MKGREVVIYGNSFKERTLDLQSKKVSISKDKLENLKKSLKGELHFDEMMRVLYATDASIYRQLPTAVAIPETINDIQTLVAFANKNGSSLIPRTAGTSLAGQCVGEGIVVDTSKHFNEILEINAEESWVRVQPGVVRDELNIALKPYGLFFGPNTSTSNRCMLGGMAGNNSCGTTSVKYGNTRDHVLEIKAILSDGSEAHFAELNAEAFVNKKELQNLEGQVYRLMDEVLGNAENRSEIKDQFPHPGVTRRNTGYALDEILDFWEGGGTFNYCKLLTGSEGTLGITTELKLNLEPLPPVNKALVCAHFHSLEESLRSTVISMNFAPFAVELMDKAVMDCTIGQREYEPYRFFIEGDPAAVLCVELGADNPEDLQTQVDQLIAAFQAENMGYSFPIIRGKNIGKVWALRKAGLGLLANIPGDRKAVAFVEDTAVRVEDLPAYIRDFSAMLAERDLSCVYYAHAGAGELHLRPLLDLKKKGDRELMRDVGWETAKLVKKYRGANSGEHGDGRVRGEFLEMLVGEKCYQLFKDIKFTFDPNNIFNPGNVVDSPPMNEQLRYEEDQETQQFDTVMNFDPEGGILRMAEKCNGSGDCRKTHLSGGTMCPSFMATRDEKNTTRARANILREVLTRSNDENPFAHKDIKGVMDLCMSCKGCTSECPSNVDMTTLKAEWQHQYYQKHGISARTKFFGSPVKINALASKFAPIANFFSGNSITGGIAKKILGIAPERTLPVVAKQTVASWYKKNKKQASPNSKGKVFFFNDEFTNYLDAAIGIKAIRLLRALGYEVEIPEHTESARAQLSKGLLAEAQTIAQKNFHLLKDKISSATPLLGVEPSAILGFRDEYLRLVKKEDRAAAVELGKNALMLEEFLWREVEAGRISASDFNKDSKKILLHGHCHQKSLSSVNYSAWILDLPSQYEVEIVPSGCCGMAGSFGYEAEHYEVSMKIGELVLFPAVREKAKTVIIAAPGTSCRHQIHDGTGRNVLHPIEILWEALANKKE